MTQKLIILNNKSNFTKQQFIDYQNALKDIKSNSKLVLCPSSCYLSLFNLENYSLGSQNVSLYEEGAYTGEIAVTQLKSLSVEYSLVGHYERKKYFNETIENINKKIINLLQVNIVPIVCIGESFEEYQNGLTKSALIKQLDHIFKNLEKEKIEQVIIAYEPVWSIGTGKIPSIDELDNSLEELKKYFPNNTLIYGGSITEQNINYLKESKYLDGYLLGNLCLNIEKYQEFLQELEK